MAKTTKKAAPSKASARTSAANKARTKGEIFSTIATTTGLSRKQVSQVFDCMRELIEKDLGKKGPGVFAVPGMMKLKAVHKSAEKATTRANPFKPGEMMTVKAKPARTVVKIRPLKSLKDAI